MEFRYLRYLVAVAEKQSFTKAAETLGMAQPPLSQQIRKFEQEVGTPLFHRLTRSVELTEAGLSLYQDAKGRRPSASPAVSLAPCAWALPAPLCCTRACCGSSTTFARPGQR